MNIGQAAAASGLPPKTIRYYESVGLIPAPERAGSGYRLYGETDVQRLRFICRARDLGFSVETVEQLLGLWQDRNRPSSEVKSHALRHLETLDRKIAELEAMRRALLHLANHCQGNERPDCPILDDLSGREQQTSS